MTRMTDTVERELKLVPIDPGLLDRLAQSDRLGPFEVRGRRRELQRNSFFDSASRALSKARIGFRRRIVSGQPLATWSLKGDGELQRGVATRSEIELQLDPDMAPALALGVLRDAARSRGAAPVAEAVDDALASGGLPLARPIVETETDRSVLDLETPERDWSVELALEAAREAISSIVEVHPSESSKLRRAMTHLEDCDCPKA